jgi:phosphatidate cytidylyltransferase
MTSTSEVTPIAPGRRPARKIATGVVLAALAVGALLAGRIPLAVLVGVLLLGAYFELRRLFGGPAAPASVLLGAAAVGGFVWAGMVGRPERLGGVLAGLVLALLVSRVLAFEGGSRTEATTDLAATLAAAGVAGALGAHIVLVRSLPPFGLRGTIVLGLTVLLNDVAAWAVGSRIGRHPLAPQLSSSKTVEGAVAGFVASVVAGLVCGIVFDPPLGATSGLWLGVLMGVLAPVGDLAGSAIKRSAGVRDSAGYLPGMGGIFDLLDALLFCAPAFYWAYRTLVL